MTTPPSANGTQPPSITLSMLADRKVVSMRMNGSISAAAANGDQRHIRQITMNAIMPVTTMVPETAMP